MTRAEYMALREQYGASYVALGRTYATNNPEAIKVGEARMRRMARIAAVRGVVIPRWFIAELDKKIRLAIKYDEIPGARTDG